MELWNRTLVAALGLLIAVMVSAAVWWSWTRPHPQSLSENDLVDQGRAASVVRRSNSELAAAITLRTIELAKTREQLEAAEKRWSEQSRRSAELAANVERLQHEIDRLRKERNEAIEFALILLDELLMKASGNAPAGQPTVALEQPPGKPEKTEQPNPGNHETFAEQLLAEIDQLRQQLEQNRQTLVNVLEHATSLEAALENQHLRLVQAARRVASQESAERLVPVLIEELSSPYPEVRRWAASVLEALGPEAQPAIERLTELLQDPDQQVRRAAEAALLRIRD